MQFTLLQRLKELQSSRLIWIVLFSGLLLRLSGLSSWSFGFDQVQIFEAAEKITQADFTLIGPRTGPASLFTGPLIYYLTAAFLYLRLGYFSLIASTLLVALTTGKAVYLLACRFTSRATALSLLILWAFSAYLIRLDQVTWNPNFTLLAASLVFFPIVGIVQNKKMQLLDYCLGMLGGFLAYQAHFSGFLLVPLSLLGLLGKDKKAAIGFFLSVGLGLVVSLVPTILFDYRHGWGNAQGLQELFLRMVSGDLSGQSPFVHMWRSLATTLESIVGIILHNFWMPAKVQLLWALAGIVYFVMQMVQKKLAMSPLLLACIVWLGIGVVLMSMYPGDKPPYYYIFQLPAVMLLLVHLLNTVVSQSVQKIGVVLFVCFALSTQLHMLTQENPFSISNTVKISEYLQEQARVAPIHKIILHVAQGDAFGLQHAISRIPVHTDAVTDWYISNPSRPVFSQWDYGKVSLWSQPVVAQGTSDYFSTLFRIRLSGGYLSYPDKYYVGNAKDALALFQNGEYVGVIERYDRSQVSVAYPEHAQLFADMKNGWKVIDAKRAFFLYEVNQTVFVLSSQRDALRDEIEHLSIY